MDSTTQIHNKMMRPRAHSLLDEVLDEAQKLSATGQYAVRMHFCNGQLMTAELESKRDGKIKDNGSR